MPTVFDFTSGVVADTNVADGSTTRQATQTIGADTLTVALDSASGRHAVVMTDTDFFGGDIPNLNGAIFAMVDDAFGIANSLTLSLDGGKIFDLTSINIADQNFSGDVTYIFTTAKGSVQATIDTSSGAVVVPFTDPKLQGVTSVVITQQGGGLFPAVDDIRLDNITLPNAAPTFVGAGATLSVAQNGGASSASALLHVSDTDSSQTLTWTSFTAPTHGTLSISGVTAASGGADITPGGVITYTPAAGFAGVDTFTVQVSDGVTTANRVISVNVGPATPGAPDLAANSDSGSSGVDNITNADALNFSGASAGGDSASSVRVFLDKNDNGVFDAGDVSATATVANGSWTVNGLSTTGLSDGDYNVYAQVTATTGALTSSLSSGLVVHIDKTGPGQTVGSLSLSADSGGSASDFITKTAAQTISATLSGALASGDVLHGSLDGGSTWTDITSKVSGTTVTWDGVTLSGSDRLQMRVVDAAGNGGTIASQNYTLDTTNPAPPAALDMGSASDTGVSNTDNITAITTPTFTGTAESGATVTLYDTDGSTVLGSVTATGGFWSITSASLSEGDHILTATATDAAGNVSAASDDLTVTIDTTAPTVTITSSASTLKIGETTTITFTFSEDPEATFASNDIAVSGGTLGAISGSGLTRTATFTPTADVNSGTASITVAASSYADVAGNSGLAGPTPSLTFDTLAPSAPSKPALNSGSDSGVQGDGVTNIDTPTFTGTSEAGATVKLYDTDESTVLGSTVADGLGNWTIVSSQLSLGAHTITAKATDLAGNVSSPGPVMQVTIETVQTPEPQPEPGVVTVVTPGGNQVTGDAQDNLIAPSGGADTVSAGGGNDTVQGGTGNDVLQGNVGNDSIAAGGGSDLAYGGQGDDFVNGNSGDDRLYGDKGDDTLHGGQGTDFVQGGQGSDYISGDLGDDVLLGGQGDDRVLGGAGNDYLSGDLGNDTLTGGAGADIFHSFGGAGLDLVTDFNRAEGDRVMLDPGTSYTLKQVAGDVHIDMVGGGQVILAGVQLSTLSGDWLIA